MGTKHKEKKASKVRAAKIIKKTTDTRSINYLQAEWLCGKSLGGGEGEEEQSSSSRWRLEEEREIEGRKVL